MCPTCLAGQLSSPVHLPRGAFQTLCWFLPFLLLLCLNNKAIPANHCVFAYKSGWISWVVVKTFFSSSLYDWREWTVGCKSLRKSTLYFPLIRSFNVAPIPLGLFCACGLNALCWSMNCGTQFSMHVIATASHLRQDTGDDPLFWRSLFFNGSYFSPFHLSISLECWGFCDSSVWACNCQRPLLTIPVFCMWKALEGTMWALN